MTRRVPWQPIAAAALLVLLAALATLQYRWLGDVSAAERERMRTSLRSRVADFTEAFDRELTRAYVAFHLDPRVAESPAPIRDAFVRWQSAAAAPDLIRAVYLFEPRAPLRLMKLDTASGALEAAEWPPALAEWRARTWPAPAGDLPPLPPEPVDASIPALVVAQPVLTDPGNRDRVTILTGTDIGTPLVILTLDAESLRRQLVEPLVGKYFGAPDRSEFLVTIARRDRPGEVVYASDAGAIVDERTADATSGLFDLRIDELARLNPPAIVSHDAGSPMAKMAITIVRRGSGRGRIAVTGSDQGGWQVRARYRGGSLDAIVERSRRRNLAIGLGVLGLLAASFALIVAAAARQQRLARQQLEFVAAVSHELRTPAAVIRSAAENLADGVVTDADQVRRYGSLIGSEGRRLSDLVERVLQFAGVNSEPPARARAEVDPARIVEEAAASVRAEEASRPVDIVVSAAPVPRVVADGEALRSAFHNVIANAVKYSRDGARVEVRVGTDADRVQVAVTDRGIGIDARDIPHVFDPFFRGRRAIEAQIRGTGIGLSIVRQVIRAHHGDVRVDSRAGEGTTVTIELPA